MTENAKTDFLSDIKENKISVTVFLINGVKLQGVITFFDEQALLLRRDGHTQLVYQHAISTIMPAQAVDVAED
ncbi:MAG: RNA chaperone Hfq [Alphaproteobacteria bacterium]|nr:RNA chaperone Hfq [Alphaproteobacteria bacterium]MBO7097911.1 RNA chaperone Hfq [Alphaproteobacteria bacterium]